jgi:hypothetical protein
MRRLIAVMVALAALSPALAFAQGAAADTTWQQWKGVLAPIVEKAFPWMPHQLVLLILGLALSTLYRLWRDWRDGKGTPATGPDVAAPNLKHVAIPSVIGGILAGLPGLVIGAAGDGVRRAVWAVLHRFGVLGKK